MPGEPQASPPDLTLRRVHRGRTLGLLTVRLAATLLLSILPTRLLERLHQALITRHYYPWAHRLRFYASGRAALRAVLARVHDDQGDGVALVPDYICNVVPRAAALAGFDVEPCPLDDQYLVDGDALAARCAAGDVRVVVLASLFGGQNNDPALVDRLLATDPRLVIVLDECQNLHRGNPVEDRERTYVVSSFNGKNIQGVMGGFVADGGHGPAPMSPDPMPPVARIKHELRYLAMLLSRSLCDLLREARGWLRPRPAGAPDLSLLYSVCTRHQYAMDIRPIARVSLAAAAVDILLSGQLEATRRATFRALEQYLARDTGLALINTDRVDRSPLVPVVERDTGHALPPNLALRGPYAAEDTPEQSVRERDYTISNDGLREYRTVSRP